MANTTIIDQLIVMLGLDTSRFKKGRQQAEKEIKQTKDKVKQSSDDMSKALLGVGRSIAVMFLGFESASGLVRFLANLNDAESKLGLVAKNLGMSAHQLNRWDNAIELAGGTAAEAQGALQNLSQSLTDLQATGTVSPLILLMQRLGVATRDVKGNIRTTTDLYENLAVNIKNLGYTRQNAHNLLASSGVSEGTINYLLLEKKEREEINRQAEKNNSVTDESAAKARQIEQAWTGIKQQITATGQEFLVSITPRVKEFFEWVSKTWAMLKDSGPIKTIGVIFGTIWDTVKLIYNGLRIAFSIFQNSTIGGLISKLVDYLNTGARGVAASLPDVIGDYGKAAQEEADRRSAEDGKTRAERDHNPGNLKAVGNQPHDAQGFRVFKDDWAGRGALSSQLDRYANRGINTIRGVVETYEGKDAPGNHNDIPAYIKALTKSTGRGADEELSRADRIALIDGIMTHESNRKAFPTLRAVPSAINAARGAAPSPAASGTGSKSVTNNTTVGKIDVHTQATDAKGIARDIGGAIQRQSIVAQANSGQS